MLNYMNCDLHHGRVPLVWLNYHCTGGGTTEIVLTRFNTKARLNCVLKLAMLKGIVLKCVKTKCVKRH